MQYEALFRGRNELCGVVHLELIIRVYFILTSIAAKALIRIKLHKKKGLVLVWTLLWPLAVTEPAVLCSQKPFVMVTGLTSVSACEKSFSF